MERFVIIKKLKKYILFLSIAFFLISGTHLVYLYLIENAELNPTQGGTISEAIIGSFPHFNPLKSSTGHNAYINSLLYRSLMQYDVKTQTFVPDLVSCSFETLGFIQCSLQENILWSDNTPITVEDIQASFDVIQSTKVQPDLAVLLDTITIKTNANTISFISNTPDINILNLLSQPILPKKIIETLNIESITGNLSDAQGIFSGAFILSSIILDETTGITRITLEKNKNYAQSNIYIDYLILNLFRDEAHFLKNKNSSYNIFFDNNNLVGNSIPRLEKYNFNIAQFTASFYNSETLKKDLRSFLISHLSRENLIKKLGESKVRPVYNPFFTEDIIDSAKDTSFSLPAYLKKLGYYSKVELLKNIKQKIALSQEGDLFSDDTPLDTRPSQEQLTIIESPTQEKYNFVTEDNILLKGRVPAGVDAVYVGEYKLQGFSTGDSFFYYRLLKNYDNIQDGLNTYEIYFETQGKKKLAETIIYYLESDQELLNTYKDNFFKSSTQSEKGEETVDLRSILEVNLTQEEVENLSDVGYYTLDGTPFQLKIISAQTDILMSQTLEYIIQELEKIGILVDSEVLSLGEITSKLRDKSLKYDILLLGINIGPLKGNIFPYFHSSQIENGYNFSNFGKLSLDILLEELKTKILQTKEKEKNQSKILEILKDENIVQTWYTSKYQLLIDKNIKNISIPSSVPEFYMRSTFLKDIYFLEEQKINWSEKSIGNTFLFLINKLVK